jgi:hypothetical protein
MFVSDWVRTSIQCDIACLSILIALSIWFMCNLQPLDAWNHFTMAGNCCYGTLMAR